MLIKWQRKPLSEDPFMPLVMAAFPCLPFEKGEGYLSENTKNTFSLFHAVLFTSKEAKDGLGREKKARLRKSTERQV